MKKEVNWDWFIFNPYDSGHRATYTLEINPKTMMRERELEKLALRKIESGEWCRDCPYSKGHLGHCSKHSTSGMPYLTTQVEDIVMVRSFLEENSIKF